MDKPIFVTKTYLPPLNEYISLLESVWECGKITNQGKFVLELEKAMRDYLAVPYFQTVANGTLALQLALKTVGIDSGEVITTPFSYVATTSAILWERCQPVFVDIEPEHFCIDAEQIEEAITPETKAILATHVFGYPCDVDKIADLAARHSLKVIYDGAHAFGCRYRGKTLLAYGDIATCSFHATKIFHTVEGGGCVLYNAAMNERFELMKRFGHNFDEHYCLGINAKLSELHAAMGLCNLAHLSKIISARRKVSQCYDNLLPPQVVKIAPMPDLEYNYSYYPVLFESEEVLLRIFENLAAEQIFPRRYFYPSLNTLPYLNKRQSCPVSEDICRRIACLPLSHEIELKFIEKIISIIKQVR